MVEDWNGGIMESWNNGRMGRWKSREPRIP
jgi:hypothetical protein